MIFSASDGSSADSHWAREELCRIYWRPVFVLARAESKSQQDAEDLTQGFFSNLLEKDWLAAADPGKGRFRDYLRFAFRRFCCNEWDKIRAEKRGGRVAFVSLSANDIALGDLKELSGTDSPDTLYDRRWALELIERTFVALHQEQKSKKDPQEEKRFLSLKPFIWRDSRETSYADVALQLGLSKESAVKMRVSRLRQRFGELMRQEIALTVRTAAEIDDEIQELFRVFNR